jgi:hypothetical protein
LYDLSDEARQRIREHLKTAGIDVDRIPPLVWPDDAVSAYQEHMYSPWQFTTKADIRRRKREQMERNLWWKREYRLTQKRCLYVWVFFCPGFFFGGWYTYLVGILGRDYDIFFDAQICKRIMELFPVWEPSLFSGLGSFRNKPQPPKEWMVRFAKHYQRGRWGGKPQGKAPIWAEVCDGRVTKILSRADWPKSERSG